MTSAVAPAPQDERSLNDRLVAAGAAGARDVYRGMLAQDLVPFALSPPWNTMSVWEIGPSRFADLILRPSQLIALRPPRPYRIALYRCGRNFGKNFLAAMTLNYLAQEAWGAIQAGQLSAGDATFLVCGRATDDTLDAGVRMGKSSVVETSPPFFKAEYLPGSRRIVWGDGAVSALVRTAQEPLGARGLNLAFAWLDEISSWPHWAETFGAIDLATRTGPNPRLLCTTTPSSRAPWLRELIAAPGTIDIHRPSADNASNMPPGWLEDQYARRTKFEIAEELEAELLDGVGGDLFPRGAAPIVDVVPDDIASSVRAWDLASSIPTATHRDPDFTVGLRMAKRKNGSFIVLDAKIVRARAGDVEDLLLRTASQDGRAVTIRLNQDPGQAGKSQLADLTRKLAGYRLASARETGDKITRALPFASAWQHGHVSILRGPWNEAYLSQMEAFPSKFAHDDAPDASSAAFQFLTEHAVLIGIPW